MKTAHATVMVVATAMAGVWADIDVLGTLAPDVSRSAMAALDRGGRSGIAALDDANSRLGCSAMSRAVRGGFRRPDLAEKFGLDRMVHLRFRDDADIESILERYKALGCFEGLEICRNTYRPLLWPNDPYITWLWGLDNNNHWDFTPRWVARADADIDGPEAWDITTGDSTVIVAIIDSGCRTSHPELAGRIWRNTRETAGNRRDDDANGYVDDINGWDFWNGDNTLEDIVGHGTAVTGVVGANGNNGIGHTGVDWKCKLMVVKVMSDSGGTNLLYLVNGLNYAVNNGADIINMSLGDDRGSTALRSAIDYAYTNGVTLVAAAGNDAKEGVLYPAAYTNVIAVGSSDPDDGRSAWFGADTSKSGSNWGPELDVVAPGQNIYLLSNKSDTLFTEGSNGTSLASPLVAGIASLLLSQDKTRTPAQLRAIIQSSADDLVGDPAEDVQGWDKYMGWGRVSAFDALTYGQTASFRSSRNPHLREVSVAVKGGVVRAQGAGEMVSLAILDVAGRQIARHEGPVAAVALPRSPGMYVYEVRGVGPVRRGTLALSAAGVATVSP